MSFVGWATKRQPHGLPPHPAVLMPNIMTEEALHAALMRLERAIERVERSAKGREATHSGLAESYALLEERHGLLRQRVQETVDRLDALLATERGA